MATEQTSRRWGLETVPPRSRVGEDSAGPAFHPNKTPPSEPIQPIADRYPALEEQEVTLTYYAPEAKVVHVLGGFNDWSPVAHPLERAESGEWLARLTLKSGQYEYRFLVDGVWTDDPRATQSAPNPFGGLNSVLTVALDDRADLL